MILTTIANVRHLLDANGISVRYNLIRKRVEIAIPWLVGTTENSDTVSLTHIESLASRHRMTIGLVGPIVVALADEASFNPVADWINDRPWDGVDRLRAFSDTVVPQEGYPLALRDTLIRRWLISAVAAAMKSNGFRSRGVLTLQGRQGLGKTTWGQRLMGDGHQERQLIKVDHHLDPSNKDSLLQAIEHWVVEIGELDSSLRRDISRLKGFLTSGMDKIRRPYGKTAVETQRRTIFYATVNAADFLVDPTGNTRFWTIACESLNFNHDIDMQQLFAQCAVLFNDGEQWWLTPDEEALLAEQNARHQSVSVVYDLVTEVIDIEPDGSVVGKPMTATEVLCLAGMERPTNGQARECAGYLRQWYGEPRRIQGRDRWRVVIRPDQEGTAPTDTPEQVRKSKFD